MSNVEITAKQKRLSKFLDRHNLDGALLTLRNNFAWITGGRDNHIANNSPAGVATILATREKLICLANTIESPRFLQEELAGMGIDVITFAWWDRAAIQKAVREVIGDRRVATDSDDFGLGFPQLPGEFNELRWSLDEHEIARYRDGAARATRAMEQACHQLKPGDNEHDAAGWLDHFIHRQGCNPVVTLVASDERIERFRHPIPVNKKIQRYVMLVTCAEFGGLISCLTRFVHFGRMPAELKEKHQIVCNIDAAVNLATKPGRKLGDIFTDLQTAYAAHGFGDQWQYHHQGGTTGYAGREAFAVPGSEIIALENQAFAWNPSLPGVKSEDTVLCTARGIEVLTNASKDWPIVVGRSDKGDLPRPDMLVR
jgi:Xaa-Pro dipeptidase